MWLQNRGSGWLLSRLHNGDNIGVDMLDDSTVEQIDFESSRESDPPVSKGNSCKQEDPELDSDGLLEIGGSTFSERSSASFPAKAIQEERYLLTDDGLYLPLNGTDLAEVKQPAIDRFVNDGLL